MVKVEAQGPVTLNGKVEILVTVDRENGNPAEVFGVIVNNTESDDGLEIPHMSGVEGDLVRKAAIAFRDGAKEDLDEALRVARIVDWMIAASARPDLLNAEDELVRNVAWSSENARNQATSLAIADNRLAGKTEWRTDRGTVVLDVAAGKLSLITK